ncbi:MAG: excinuclease ABC subunit UvrA [Candidatus Kapabacteria bacterium]|nr:excinuclease ABC subunit UvrA [Candidatus Kapabacteria bacterium]
MVKTKTKRATTTAIEVVRANVNNLKDVSVRIPHNRLTVITGVSGSGKSSLAFDTLYAEGQRRFVESLSAYARQFLERKGRPNVERISGLPPAIALEQKPLARNPRSIVATATEVYDYFRLLFGHVGKTICHQCQRLVRRDTPQQVVADILQWNPGERIMIGFVPSSDLSDIQAITAAGFIRVADLRTWEVYTIGEETSIPEESQRVVIVDRVTLQPEESDTLMRLTEAVETAFRLGRRVVVRRMAKEETYFFSPQYECSHCGIRYQEPTPRLFSFNSPYGACPTCEGFGRTIGIDEDLVIPDRSRSLAMGAIHPFRNYPVQAEMLAAAKKKGIPIDVPVAKLSAEQYRWLWEGDETFFGINGYFKYLEDHAYKVQNRIMLARYRGYTRCPSCNGSRLRRSARQVYVGGINLPSLLRMTIEQAHSFFEQLELPQHEIAIVEHVLREIRWRLRLLCDIGVEYLTLDRLSHTLSGGEAQRLSIATSLGSTLVGTLYVLDEPSIGLHWRDTQRLIRMLHTLRSVGNTVVVVEHDPDIIRCADYVVDMGPGAGENGGRVVAAGTPAEIMQHPESLTGAYLAGRKKIELPRRRTGDSQQMITIVGARENNLRIEQVDIPLHRFVVVTGVSGSGKSTLIEQVLYANAKRHFGGTALPAGRCDEIRGLEFITDIELVDQSPVGRSSRSTPATYTKAFDAIREVFAETPAARERGWTSSHFSFNVPGGRCEVCEGAGSVLVEMQFLPDIEVPCEACGGTRYKQDARSILYNGKSIVDVLNMTIDEAAAFFKGKRKVLQRLKTLQDVGLGYLKLGQSSLTLSGGEAQRLKLAAYLDAAASGHVLYLFDEPTTGLHLHDIAVLLRCFERLIERGQSVVVIEHNLHVIAAADWIIDLGPGAGEEGGQVVCVGTPEDIAMCEESWTGKALQEFFASAHGKSSQTRKKR